MSISHFISEIRQFKQWFEYGGELLWLRLRMLRLDAVEQIRSIILLIVTALASFMVFFLGIISLLFALNSLLSTQAKIWTFSIMAILFAITLLAFIVYIIKLWHQQGRFMDETLQAMHDDLNYLHRHRSPKE